jgi:hypothetical protein
MANALGVGNEIAQRVFRPAEGALGVDDLEQGRGAGVEQQVINQPLVLQGKWASSRGRVKTTCT